MKEDGGIFLPVPYVSLFDIKSAELRKTTCGLVCLAMVLNAFEIDTTVESMVSRFGINVDNFISISQIMRVAKSYGVPFDYHQPWTLEEMQEAISAGQAIIAVVNYGTWSKIEPGISTQSKFTGPHTVVVVGIDDENVYIHDPLYGGPRREEGRFKPWDREQFLEAWKNAVLDGNPEFAGIVCTRTLTTGRYIGEAVERYFVDPMIKRRILAWGDYHQRPINEGALLKKEVVGSYLAEMQDWGLRVVEHTITESDTFGSIALKYYDDPMKWNVIRLFNGMAPDDPLYDEGVLIIPEPLVIPEDAEEQYLTPTTIEESIKPPSAFHDRPEGPDRLDFTQYVNAFVDLLLNPETTPPITIGIYAAWGMGKSFLMKKINEEMDARLHKRREGKNNRQRLREWFYRQRPEKVDQLTEREKRNLGYWARFLYWVNTKIGREKLGKYDYLFIPFNAWVYSGSEHLWAGLITHLYNKVENHLGWRAVYFRLWLTAKRSVLRVFSLLLTFGLLAALFSVMIGYADITAAFENTKSALSTFLASIVGGSALLTLPKLLAAIKDLSDNLFLSRSKTLKELSSRKDFRDKIGVMAEIKEEIETISRLLNRGKYSCPTRVILFIDDLDRCQKDKAVEVLQAIMLLLADEDGAPFIIFLGIDARVIVKAIEEQYGDVLVKAGITGYEYLDKIVQIPFCIPPAGEEQIKNYLETLLFSTEEERNEIVQKTETEKQAEEPAPEVLPAAELPELDGEEIPERVGEDQQRVVEEFQQTALAAQQTEEEEKTIRVTLTDEERKIFRSFSDQLMANPRRIKRMLNIYRYARRLVPEYDFEKRKKHIRWLILTEQWPFRAAWMMEKIENDFQNKTGHYDKPGSWLSTVYSGVQKDIYAQEVRHLFHLDADPDLFIPFLKAEPILTVSDVIEFIPLTFNLNPAIKSEVAKAAIKS